MNNYIISMESCRRDLFIDMDVDRLIFKNNKITVYPCFIFIPKLGYYLWAYFKQGLVFTGWKTFLRRKLKRGLISLKSRY